MSQYTAVATTRIHLSTKKFFFLALGLTASCLLHSPNPAQAQAVMPAAALPAGKNGNASNNYGSVRSFSINTGSNFSPSVTATSTPGVPSTATQNVIFSEPPALSSSVNCGSGSSSCAGSWTHSYSETPTGSNGSDVTSFQGASASIVLKLDPKSTMSTSVDTSKATQTITTNSGSASASFNANTSLTVTSQENNFTNTLINAF